MTAVLALGRLFLKAPKMFKADKPPLAGDGTEPSNGVLELIEWAKLDTLEEWALFNVVGV